MRLVDLFPRWVHPNVFAFLCPCCREVFLTCKNAPMSSGAQYDLMEADPIGQHDVVYVLCKASCAWQIQGADFATMTVTPSLDASAAGHWHGNITGGEIK